MDNSASSPLLFRGGAARLGSLLTSRSGVVSGHARSASRIATIPNPSSEEEGGL
jgi:hypothetical protein